MKKSCLVLSAVSIYLILSSITSFAQVQFEATDNSGHVATAIGENTRSLGRTSFSGGTLTNASGDYSFSFGFENISLGQYSISFGNNCFSNSDYSLSYGLGNSNSGIFSFVNGEQASITSDFALAMGSYITSSGLHSFSFGNNLTTSGDYSTTFGQSSITSGNYSYSFGENNVNHGTHSFTLGSYTNINTGIHNSFVFGTGLQGSDLQGYSNSFVVGFNSNMPTLYVNREYGMVGKVGIETVTPGSQLQVNGNVAIGYNNSTIAPSNGLAINGNVGIGIINPSSSLQINGNAAIGFSTPIVGPTNGLAVSGKLGVGIVSTGSQFQVNGNSAIGFSTSVSGPTNGLAVGGGLVIGKSSLLSTGGALLEVYGGGGIVSGGSQMKYIIHTQGWSSTGAFSVAPWNSTLANWDFTKSFTLDIDGHFYLKKNLYVQETIYAQEIIVQVPPFPDYVFEDNYKLMPLKELEAYITSNKHLPNIQSADSVAKNNLNIGDMQVILLEKIEELTLYTIEQQKQIEILSKELEGLK